MSATVGRRVSKMSRRGLLLLVLVALTAASFMGSVSSASAGETNYCTGVSLARYGQPGDRCWGPSKLQLDWSGVITHERAGCADIADGSNNLLMSWACGGSGSYPGIAAWVERPVELGTHYKGVIRNNNEVNSGIFGGYMACFGGSGSC